LEIERVSEGEVEDADMIDPGLFGMISFGVNMTTEPTPVIPCCLI
jgi:hypothetical protein